MMRYIFLFLTIAIFILITFFIAEHYHIPLLKDPTYILHQGGMIAALTGIGLLVADVIFPIPSSLIMIANGAVFGIWMGTLLSMVGGVLASLTGFYLGKKSSALISKFISAKEQQTAKALMQKWGMTALIVSRSIPVLAETVSIFAGTTQMKWRQILISSVLGLFPAAIIYAVTGAMSLQIESAAWSFVLVLIVATIFWGVGKYVGRKSNKFVD